MTAEGRDRLSGLLLIRARIIHDDGLLRILGWEFVRNEKRRGGQPHAFGRGTSEFDELLGGNTVTLVQRLLDSELFVVARHNRRTLTKTRIDHRLYARLVANIGELRCHVAVARSITLLGGNRDPRLRRDGNALVAHRLAEGIGPRDHCDRR